ncbi:MAG: glycoside hydrolase family 28 protein [Clostridia bacterium]|nr:glycoside hydrolase family 28 protein [Clostridia bacterium]
MPCYRKGIKRGEEKQMKLLFAGSRSCTVLMDERGDYYAAGPYAYRINGGEEKTDHVSVLSLFDLEPDSDYSLSACVHGRNEELSFRTQSELCTLDVKEFGAAGDGKKDDTSSIQAAILACPEKGRVLIPEGNYSVGPLFLKSGVHIEIAKGARLCLTGDRERFPLLPGRIQAQNETKEYLIGTWEGERRTCYAAAITGIGVKNVVISGEGTVDGCAQEADWWQNAKDKVRPSRPRLLYLRSCKNVTVQGVTFQNSPSWNLHPCFSEDLRFLSVRVKAPADSPNTDGFDPESCRGVKMYGTEFSVGDDCIAIKSGKMYMGEAYRTPCEDIEIAWCRMLDGHGGVTVGSEMSGGVKNVRVHHCLMQGNDRGLRIKTRRGRGRWGVIDDIVFSDVKMENVKAPLTVNAMYFCDVDGKGPFVQSREPQKVDDGTPTIGRVTYERVRAENCTWCAAYILGLPENPAEELRLKDCLFTMDPDAAPKPPVMAMYIESCARRGVIARFVKRVILDNVAIEGIDGPRVEAADVNEVKDF